MFKVAMSSQTHIPTSFKIMDYCSWHANPLHITWINKKQELSIYDAINLNKGVVAL